MHLRLKAGAAATIAIVLTTFSAVTMVEAEDEAPPTTESTAPPVTMTVVVVPETESPPAATAEASPVADGGAADEASDAPGESAPEVTPVVAEPAASSEPDANATETTASVTPTSIGTETTTAAVATSTTTAAVATSTTNPVQIDQEQTAVVTGTVVAQANTGANSQHIEQPAQGGGQLPADVDTGSATAVGSDDENVITQGADVTLTDQAVANLLQVALILNIGAALANSGLNTVDSGPGGTGASGAIATGGASATGLDIDQYITQAARETGDADTDAHATQVAMSLWMGLALANSGANAVTGTGVAGSGGGVDAGNASATGNDSLTEISQYANLVGTDQSTINVTQRSTVLNLGFALANSGLNDVAGAAGGLLSATPDDDDAQAQELFAMLLPALLQSYGYGPGQGSISSGDAAAVGNESQTFTKQVAMAAASGDGVVDIVQDVLVANMGAASANTGGNTIGSVRTLDPDTARAVVMMAAFMAQLLALVHQSASSTALAAQSQGIEIPFGDLVLTLDGAFDGLDTTVAQGGARANIRQVSIVVSLGIARANSGLNTTVSETQSAQGNRINGGGAGDSVVVLALDAAGNVVSTGRADAASGQVITICQRLNADDVACLAPPTTTTPPAPTPVATTPAAVSSAVDAASSAAPATPGAVPVAAGPAAAAAPSAFRTPAPALTTRGSLPATGTDVGTILAGATGLLFLGIALLAVRRRRPVA